MGEERSDQAFMEALYRQYSRLMYATARKYVDGPDLDDVVQSAAEKLIKRTKTLRELKPGALACYIVYTVKSVSVDHLRAKGRQEGRTVGLWDIELPQAESPEDKLVSLDRLSRLKSIWPRLSEEEQQLLWGKYIGGYSDEELAADFRCKPDSIRMKLTRARRKALGLLSEGEGGSV